MKKLLLIFALLPMLVLSQPFPVDFMEDLVDRDLLPQDTEYKFILTDEEGNDYYELGNKFFSINPTDFSVTYKEDFSFDRMLEITSYFASDAEIVDVEKTKRYTVTSYALNDKIWDVYQWEENDIKVIIINCAYIDLED